MTLDPNHRALSREHLAEAHRLADAGATERARERLVSAAHHALQALASATTGGDVAVSALIPVPSGPVLQQPDAPVDPVELVPEDDLEGGFERVQALIDAVLAQPQAPVRPVLPMYGGAAGALNARGAEAAARVLERGWALLRR
jgi:hypothetical protein